MEAPFFKEDKADSRKEEVRGKKFIQGRGFLKL